MGDALWSQRKCWVYQITTTGCCFLFFEICYEIIFIKANLSKRPKCIWIYVLVFIFWTQWTKLFKSFCPENFSISVSNAMCRPIPGEFPGSREIPSPAVERTPGDSSTPGERTFAHSLDCRAAFFSTPWEVCGDEDLRIFKEAIFLKVSVHH